MENMNFKLTKNLVKDDNPEFKSVPEFDRLTERQLRYVMLVDWYGSPLRLMKLEERKLKAALMAGYKVEAPSPEHPNPRPDMNTRNLINGKVLSVEAARKVMKHIQHDNEMDLKEAIDTQLDEIIAFFKKPEKNHIELSKAVTLMQQLPNLLETKRKIMEIMNFREIEVIPAEDLKADKEEVSFLDEYNEQENN